MTHNEFEIRTMVNVSSQEFSAINEVYMNSDLDKDEFCKMWCKMNASRVKAAKVERILAERERANRDFAWSLVNNGYTYDEMESYAIEYFNVHDYTFLVSRLHIEMIGHHADGMPYSKTLRDILWDLNKYLFPNA